MTSEAVVFPQDLFGYACKESYSTTIPGGFGDQHPSCSSLVQDLEDWHANYASVDAARKGTVAEGEAAVAASQRKRRRAKSIKNKEEEERQRMVHIAVERNRRKQSNDYLAALRSLMPPSYVQRGDQASIVGGAINYVKGLEQLLHSLEVLKRLKKPADHADGLAASFADFFTNPQYSSSFNGSSSSSKSHINGVAEVEYYKSYSNADETTMAADVEVTVVDSHANLKVLSRRQPKQLPKLLTWLQNLGLTPLHLNVTSTANHMVLYSFSLKVEDDSSHTTVNDIAAAVYEMIGRIQPEANFSN